MAPCRGNWLYDWERYDAKVGRVVFKYLNDDYLLNAKLADADATDL